MGPTVVEEIIAALAEAEGRDPTNLDVVLQNWVDTDAIRLLVDQNNDAWTLQFELPDHSVTVTGESVVFVDGTERRTFS